MRSLIRQSLIMFGVLTVLTGLIYPLVVTGIAQALFPWQANGSLIERGAKTVGSALIGQEFTSKGYFWSRPSATTPPYNAASSGGSNLSPTGEAEEEIVTKRVEALRSADPLQRGAIPADLVTASGSGLDPDISPAAAYYQVPRVAAARGIPTGRLDTLVEQMTKQPFLGVIGEPRVNVLELNLALDRMERHAGT
ncbi:MAG TPA: potassium-transporting ATPase subunit KdpC [Spirochaetia bacterium]|nr:potassium-transporting ATPase subunit KdpC [Spirochaetia bacterium]